MTRAIASITNMRALILLLLALVWPSLAQAQSYTVAPSPFLTILDNSGNVVNAGCIWTYAAGTSTAATTYSDSAGTTNANPIIADSAGRFTAYLTPGSSYKFVYENTPCSSGSHGTTLRTADNIAAVPVSGLNVDIQGTAGVTLASGDLAYVSDGSGGNTAGQWYQADADNTYSSTTAVKVGFATAAISATSSGTFRTTGRVTGLTGLTTGELYYASATAGALTSTPPTNAVCVGKADSTTSLVMPCDATVVRVPDSDGTHSVVVATSSNLTADRLLTVVPGDAARTVTLSGNPTLGDWFDQSVKTTAAASFNRFIPPAGRCTLETGVAVSTTDQTGKTTLYYTPYSRGGGAVIALYDGSTRWVQMSFAQLSIAVPATTDTMYDVFVDYTAGTPALEVVAWTNDTTRATALATQNDVYVQTSDTDSLYVCSFRTTGVSGQTEDSFAKRYVWNYYNRVPRAMRVLEATATWTYGTTTWRQARATATNQLDFVVGVAEVPLHAEVRASGAGDSAADAAQVAIGLNSTSAPATGNLYSAYNTSVAGYQSNLYSVLDTYPAIGRSTAVWLEWGQATITFYGNSGTDYQLGITGWIEG